ncbi:outer membrane protein assembly factor BamB family protein [Foetidibacter luteolus]|uniref:outer membrane protein assembly factor BamB family protein n=1 Tax=Foetidibacter luteolus TaxID=2608880 RepID=UPI001A981C1B|nr:PQQ-binding-like beta-propeller repeat protein [Foetidibacter luteolus]
MKFVKHSRPRYINAIIPAFALVSLFACKSGSDEHTTWMDYGGGPDQSKYVVVDDITKENVNQLQVAWSYAVEDGKTYQWNPVIVDTVMYVLAKNSSLVALNAVTAKEIWIHANLTGIARRGINYWESKDRKDRRLIFQINNYLQAIDATTGKSILSFGNKGLVDLKEALGGDPKKIARVQSGTPGKIFENLIILGSAPGENHVSTPGHCRAYDVVTGKLVWIFHTVPQPGEFGYDTWPKDAYKYIGGVNTWGEITVDDKRGIAYFPLGSPTYDYYGGDRVGANLFGNCLLAVDARTGKRLWHYQTVHHDLWDYDLAAAPQLITVDHDGKKTDAVAVAGKNGFLYVFDRVTGEPLWPIEEKPVPASDIPGEQAWPTQPHPTVVPPFNRQKLTSADLNPYFLSDAEKVDWQARVDTIPSGLFVPVSMDRETISMPGAVGGASWGSTASIPEKGLMFVRTVEWPSVYGKVKKISPPTKEELEAQQASASGQKIYMTTCMACHGADRRGGVGPELLSLKSRHSFKDFQQVLHSGKGEMPAFPGLKEEDVKKLYQYITSGPGGGRFPFMDNIPFKVTGPVVDSGGAPGGLEQREVTGLNGAAMFGQQYGVPYPEDADVPLDRYFIPPGWGLNFPYIISPPWSTITAYDLNTGKIKWQIPIGSDKEAEKLGAKNTGMLRAQRQGMVVTSTGVLFCTGKDGKLYAFDVDNGRQLWSYELPAVTEAIPAMYEINGKHYLALCATAPLVFGRQQEEKRDTAKGPATPPEKIPGAYVVFALPEK